MCSRCGRAGVLALALLSLLTACDREQRRFSETPPSGSPSEVVRVSALQPGPAVMGSSSSNRYDGNAYAVSQGQRLFTWYNCAGCHANGGGGMGPPLMDDEWIYGHRPDQIFKSIVEGRPNGMPSFQQRIPDYQVWQIAAYVRSMGGLVPKDAAPGRDDHLSGKHPESSTEKMTPINTSPSVVQ